MKKYELRIARPGEHDRVIIFTGEIYEFKDDSLRAVSDTVGMHFYFMKGGQGGDVFLNTVRNKTQSARLEDQIAELNQQPKSE